ncbi:MAG: carboxylesterase family protein, partial [Salegentibacter sp.]
NSEQPVYRYMFSRIQPRLKKGNGQTPTGAPHASEIPYFLGNLSLIENGDWTKQDYAVSEVIQKYLANFINTGNPNGEGLPKWPAAEEADTNPPVMILDVDSRARPAEDEARYLFLDNFYGND